MTGTTLLLAGVDPALAERVRERLGDGFVVLETTDAAAAFRHLRTTRVDALLAGTGVDDREPLAFLREARSIVGADLPVLLLTEDASLAASALEAGATDYADSGAAGEHPALLVERVRNLLGDRGADEAGLVPVALYAATRDLPAVDREDDAVEVGLRVGVDGETNVLAGAAERAGRRLTVEGITPRPGGGGLLRVGVGGADTDEVRRAVRESPGVVEAEPVEGNGLRLLVSELGLLSHLAEHGARIRSLAVDPEGADVTVGLPASVDVRSFVEACRARYPDTELVARRECEPSEGGDPGRVRLPDGLTDRQREAVLAAHREGYFEWPRESTGEEVAGRLGVSGPTFHQHLRKGLARILDALAADLPERPIER